MKNLNDKQQEKIRAALLKGEAVLDSELWASRIRCTTFTENNKHTGKQIVDMIRSGSHNGGPADEVIDINIQGFYERSNTVGYTYLGSLWQHFNRKYLDIYSHADIFRHVMHETMHRCFLFRHTRSHKTSVPYRVGEISGKVYKEFYPEIVIESFTSYHTNIIQFMS